jgi:hypothetical protein
MSAAAQPSDPPPLHHNPIFKTLITDDGDLVGMVAYSIYKKMKQEWIVTHAPTPEEIRSFHKTVTATQLELCRNKAEQKLSAFGQAIVGESADAYRQEGAESEIVNQVKRQQSIWVNLSVSVLGSLIFTAMLALLWAALNSPSFQEIARPLSGATQPRNVQ